MPERTGDEEDRVFHGGELPEDDNSLDDIVVDPLKRDTIDDSLLQLKGNFLGASPIQIPDGTIAALTSLAPEVPIGATCYTVPGHFDLNRYGELELQFQKLGIPYFKQDVYPAFLTPQALDEALLAVYDSGWEESWAFEDYLVQYGLVGSQIMLAVKLQAEDSQRILSYALIYMTSTSRFGASRTFLPKIHSPDPSIAKSRITEECNKHSPEQLKDYVAENHDFLVDSQRQNLEKIRFRIPSGFPTNNYSGFHGENVDYAELSNSEMEIVKGTPGTESGKIGKIVISVI